MRGDDPDHGVTHFPVRPVSGPLSWGHVVAWVRIVRQAQVGAQHVDAGLLIFGPVISQARHGIHPG